MSEIQKSILNYLSTLPSRYEGLKLGRPSYSMSDAGPLAVTLLVDAAWAIRIHLIGSNLIIYPYTPDSLFQKFAKQYPLHVAQDYEDCLLRCIPTINGQINVNAVLDDDSSWSEACIRRLLLKRCSGLPNATRLFTHKRLSLSIFDPNCLRILHEVLGVIWDANKNNADENMLCQRPTWPSAEDTKRL